MNNLPEELPDASPADGPRSAPVRATRRLPDAYPSRSNNAFAGYPANGRNSGSSLDAWSLFDPLARNWGWPVFIGLALAAAGLFYAWNNWSTTYTSTAQLIYRVPPAGENAYRPRTVVMPTLAGMMRSPELLRRVGAYAKPALTPTEVNRRIAVTPERDSEILNVSVTGRDLNETVALTQVFTREAVRFTQEMQSREAAEAAQIAGERLSQIGSDLSRVESRLASVPLNTTQNFVPTPGQPTPPPPNAAELRLAAARDELDVLLSRYTDAHPLVREQRARIKVLEQHYAAQTPAPETSSRNAMVLPAVANRENLAGPSGEMASMSGASQTRGDDVELLRHQARFLEDSRRNLMSLQRTAALVQKSPPGYLAVLVAPDKDSVLLRRPHVQIGVFTLFLGMLGFVVTAATIVGRELLDNRVKTSDDLRRITNLPVLATLGHTGSMTDGQRDRWAFRAWTSLQQHLNIGTGHGLVCGFTSSQSGEGRSMVVRLLASAATQRGFRVLTIAPQPGGASLPKDAKAAKKDSVVNEQATLASNALANPAALAAQLQRPDAPPRVDLPFPAWVWSVDRRKQWAEALREWSKIENLVILVELPPASVPEAVLLAESLPNLVWVAESGYADCAEVSEQLETFRQARCNLVGTVLNRESAPPVRHRFTRWIGASAVALVPLFFTPDVSAQSAAPETASTGGRLTASAAQRAEWQQRLTLGPGDVLSVALFGDNAPARQEVTVGPDGTISFLEARGLKAAGLTIDELRAKLDEELSRTRRAPRTLVSPINYRSKNYVVLGKVQRRGIYPLDRPVTLVEAVARAGGFETGLRNGSVVESADFSRAFLARGDQRVQVDFDRLFRSGDLTQNTTLAPGDYLYFPPAGSQEIYVLGEVRSPGTLDYISKDSTTAVGAIAGRGGFTDAAYKSRVLVVRGSFQRPQTFALDINDVLRGKTRDFSLQPRDIIFVASRPWLRAEELLDAAASAFVQSAVLTATGRHVGPFIR